jgi:ABC-2 type transport system permease protein
MQDKVKPTEIFNAISSSCVQQFQTSIGRPMFRFCVLAQPIVFGFILGMMYLNKSDQDFMIYALLGSGLTTFWSSICFSSASDIDRERYYGTLENIYAAPVGFKWIILGKVLGNTIWGLISIGISILSVEIIFRKTLIIANPLWILIGFLLMTLSFIALAFMLAGFFTLSRNSRILMNCMEHPIYILCGMVFPVEYLPTFIQPLSWLLSPTWAVKILRYSVTGGQASTVLPYIWGLLAVTIIYGLLASRIFKTIDIKVRIEATLEVY